MEGTILKNSDPTAPTYHCGSPTGAGAAYVKTGVIDLSYISKGMLGVLVNGGIHQDAFRPGSARGYNYLLELNIAGTRATYIYYSDTIYFNAYKIINAPEGVLREFFRLCFHHPENLAFEYTITTNINDQPAIQFNAPGIIYHPRHQNSAPHGWNSKCNFSNSLVQSQSRRPAGAPSALYVYF